MISRVVRLIFIIAICLTVSSWTSVQAEPTTPREYMIKAGFLYNFAKFVDWPEEVFENSSTPLIIGILGEDPFGNDLDQIIKKKTVKERSILIKRLKTLDELKVCHILFISASEKSHLSKVISKTKDWHVLTVSEMEGFAELGGIINFTKEGNKIRFEINLDAAEQSGLKISSRLLKLAKIIREKD